jgi:hypothetical protein
MRSMDEPNWPPPEWGTPEPGWDIPANVGRVDTEDDVHADPVVLAQPVPTVRTRPQRWCELHRIGYRSPSRHEECRPRPTPVDSLTDEKIDPTPQVVVVHQSLTHRINELENSVLRLERRLGQLERRQSIDDIHDGPWEMDPVH